MKQNPRRTAQRISAAAFSGLLVIGVAVCMICDTAISGGLSWSLIPASAIVFAWLVCFPVVRFWEKGIAGSLAALTVCTLPFLYVLGRLLQNGAVLRIGAPVAVIALVFLWLVFALFWRLRDRRMVAAAVTLLLVIPLGLGINISLSMSIGEPVLDLWDAAQFLAAAVAAAVLLGVERSRRKTE